MIWVSFYLLQVRECSTFAKDFCWSFIFIYSLLLHCTNSIIVKTCSICVQILCRAKKTHICVIIKLLTCLFCSLFMLFGETQIFYLILCEMSFMYCKYILKSQRPFSLTLSTSSSVDKENKMCFFGIWQVWKTNIWYDTMT